MRRAAHRRARVRLHREAGLRAGPRHCVSTDAAACPPPRPRPAQVDSLLDDDCLAIDLPGQVELYAHLPILKSLVSSLERSGYRCVVVFLLDAHFVTDAAKLLAGNLAALAAMCHFELPHVNVLSKCDLVGRDAVERYLTPAGAALLGELNAAMGARYARLNAALARVLDEYDMVGFVPLDLTDEDSLDAVLAQVDHAIQYGEDAEPKEPREFDDGAGAGDGDDDGGVRDRLAEAAHTAASGGGDFFGGADAGGWHTGRDG